MESENVNNWIQEPNVCRCCLSTNGEWDLTVSYLNDEGKCEVYSEILQECYGISLEYTTWNRSSISRMVCGVCIGHLKDARNFRSQVINARDQFLTFCSRHVVIDPDIKLEVDDLNYPDETHNLPDNYNDENSDTNHLELEANYEKEFLEKRKSKRIKAKRKNNNITNSDRAVTKSSKRVRSNSAKVKTDNELAQPCDIDRLDRDEEERLVKRDPVSNIEDQNLTLKKTKPAKLISERKRIMSTCEIVLRDTTACPFRHHKSWFQCFYCHQAFMSIGELKTHVLTLHADVQHELKKTKRYPGSLQIDISDLECKICGVKLNDVDVMTTHFEVAHSKEIFKECIADFKVNGSPYTCHLCKQEFHVFRTLTTHLNEHYANCICDVCGKSFLNSKRLKVHKRTHEQGHYPCSECGKVLSTKTSHINHMQSAHSKRGMKCQVCQLPMKHYNDRVKHMSEAHNITHTFKCKVCPRVYNIKHYLATHMRQTHGHKDKKCVECGMAFITNHGLKKHMLKHSGEKPHLCAICNKSYARSYTLKEHMRAHQTQTLL